MMEYIKKLENKSVSSKINANKYLKENKREKAKSQLKRKKLYDSQIINTKNQIKFFKRQISEILRIQKKIHLSKEKITVNKVKNLKKFNSPMKKKINKYIKKIKKPKKKFWYLNTGMVDGEKYYLWET